MAKKEVKKVAALGITAAVLAGGIGAALGAYVADDSTQVDALNASVELAQAKIAELENAEPVVINATPEELAKAYNAGVDSVNVTVEEKLVDNGNLDLVLDEIFDNDGSVEYLTDDLDADEVDEIVERIVFVNDIKSLAVEEAKSEIADLVDKEVVAGEELDEDDVEKIRIKDDADEVIVDDIDFDDRDATLLVSGDFRHDDIDYEFEVEVEIRDGKVEDIELVSVVEE
jgi:hypothetical protein